MTATLSRGELVRIALGSLVLQAAFNPERRQALGVAAALAPAARLWPEGAPRRAFLERHLENFNTNPAMAGPVLGAVARLEERAAVGDGRAPARVPRFKRAVEAPFAGAGDALLWSGARPGAGHWGSAAAVAAGAWGPALFLVLYNAVHLGLRVGGVFWGYGRGEDAHLLLRSPRLRRALAVMPWFVASGSVVLAGLALGARSGSAPRALVGAGALLAGFAAGRAGFTRGTMLAVGAMILGLTAALVFSPGGDDPRRTREPDRKRRVHRITGAHTLTREERRPWRPET